MGRVVAECAESCMSYHDGQGVQVSFCKRLMGKAAVWDLCICAVFGISSRWCGDEIFIVGVAEVNLLHEIACLACAV